MTVRTRQRQDVHQRLRDAVAEAECLRRGGHVHGIDRALVSDARRRARVALGLMLPAYREQAEREARAVEAVLGRVRTRLNAAAASGAARGGRQSKRRAWADALAEDLAERFAHVTFREAWDKIPIDPAEGDEYMVEVDVQGGGYLYRRDEHDHVIAYDADTDAELGSLARSTFAKEYHSPARQRRTGKKAP